MHDASRALLVLTNKKDVRKEHDTRCCYSFEKDDLPHKQEIMYRCRYCSGAPAEEVEELPPAERVEARAAVDCMAQAPGEYSTVEPGVAHMAAEQEDFDKAVAYNTQERWAAG